MSSTRLQQIERKRGEAQDLLAKMYDGFTEEHGMLNLQDARAPCWERILESKSKKVGKKSTKWP